jgi:cytochrome c biogenesis protein
MKALSDFFTSVKVAIVLLIILICASLLGTLVPQQRSAAEYQARYGQLAVLLQRLQVTDLYHSVWFVALLLLFSLNIIVCTLVRLVPKLRRAFRPSLDLEAKALRTLKIKVQLKLGPPLDAAGREIRAELARRRYRVREKSGDRQTAILGRKKTLGLFGSDVVHLGILIILAGGITSGLAGVRQNLTLSENETVEIPGVGFSVRLDKFTTEFYRNGSVKDWKSLLTVVEAARPAYQKSVEVNHPLSYRGYVFYQSAYGWDWDHPALEVWIKKKNDSAYLQKVSLRVGEKADLRAEGLNLLAVRFVPDFVLDEKNQPATRSLEPNNPAAYLEAAKSGQKVFSGWVFSKFPDFTRMHSTKETDFTFELKDVQAPQYSVIQMAKDPGVGLIWVGSALVMLGLLLAFYWPTREVRILLEAVSGKTEVTAGGLSAKSREAFEAEFEAIMSALRKTK